MSIYRPKVVWFSNQFSGTSKEARGKGIVGFGVNFENSRFLDFMEERVNFLLGAIDVLLKAWKGKEEFLGIDGQNQNF